MIKTIEGVIFGGFSVYPADKDNVIKPGNGCLFSVTHERVFRLKINQDKFGVLPYDDYYFMLGNSEIRLKTGEKKVYSNFGILASAFEAHGFSRSKFLGTDKVNDPEIDSYEFYQIHFEGV